MKISPKKFSIGQVKCSTHSIHQFLAEIRKLLSNPILQQRLLTCVNAHILNLAYRDESLKKILNQARIVTADGMSIVLVGRLKGEKVMERCNMTEAFRAFLRTEDMPKSRAILIGAEAEEAKRAALSISKNSKHCSIVHALSGYETIDTYKRIVKKTESIDFIMVGMGSPNSEKLLLELGKICPSAILWHIGGGTIHFYSGSISEAPIWMRRSGLQWIHRLIMEPRRMWKRYLIGNCAFAWNALIDIAGEKLNKI